MELVISIRLDRGLLKPVQQRTEDAVAMFINYTTNKQTTVPRNKQIRGTICFTKSTIFWI
jgi:hypothetical protein